MSDHGTVVRADDFSDEQSFSGFWIIGYDLHFHCSICLMKVWIVVVIEGSSFFLHYKAIQSTTDTSIGEGFL